jgi:2-polyprenyl-3-methyl-5-hydroxy-6-metoxy-1,4-benzoquinol methylase
MDTLKELFTSTYTNNKWCDTESKSGNGSTLVYTENIRKVLVEFIKKNKIKTIWDCSCGDWNWMKQIKNELPNYVGNDIVEELIHANIKNYATNTIKFQCGDMLEELRLLSDKSIDLIICRHTLEHLPSEYVIDVVKEIKRVGVWSMITSNNDSDNSELWVDGVVGRCINLEIGPYDSLLGVPLQKYYDSIGTQTNDTFGMNLYKHNIIS